MLCFVLVCFLGVYFGLFSFDVFMCLLFVVFCFGMCPVLSFLFGFPLLSFEFYAAVFEVVVFFVCVVSLLRFVLFCCVHLLTVCFFFVCVVVVCVHKHTHTFYHLFVFFSFFCCAVLVVLCSCFFWLLCMCVRFSGLLCVVFGLCVFGAVFVCLLFHVRFVVVVLWFVSFDCYFCMVLCFLVVFVFTCVFVLIVLSRFCVFLLLCFFGLWLLFAIIIRFSCLVLFVVVFWLGPCVLLFSYSLYVLVCWVLSCFCASFIFLFFFVCIVWCCVVFAVAFACFVSGVCSRFGVLCLV